MANHTVKCYLKCILTTKCFHYVLNKTTETHISGVNQRCHNTRFTVASTTKTVSSRTFENAGLATFIF